MLLLVFNQNAVVFFVDCVQQAVLFDQMVSDRSADQASGDQSVGCGCSGDGGCAFYTEVFQNRAEGACSAVSADHRNGSGAHADQRAQVHLSGKADGQQILTDDQDDDDAQKDDQIFSAAFQDFQIGLEAYRGEEKYHADFTQGVVKSDCHNAERIKNTGDDGEDQASDNRCRDAETGQKADLFPHPRV